MQERDPLDPRHRPQKKKKSLGEGGPVDHAHSPREGDERKKEISWSQEEDKHPVLEGMGGERRNSLERRSIESLLLSKESHWGVERVTLGFKKTHLISRKEKGEDWQGSFGELFKWP